MPGCRRSVAAPHIQYHRADAATNGDFTAHAVGPKTIEGAFFQSSSCGKAEGDVRARRSRNRHDLHIVFFGIDAGFQEQSLQAQVDSRSGADAETFDYAEIAAHGLQIA